MSTSAVKFKIMPSNIDVDLQKIKTEAKTVIESFESGVFTEGVEEPIAFGLKALVITIALSESEETDAVEEKLSKIEGVSSVELIDYRRAIG